MRRNASYQGWKNWQTWNVSLWVFNDEGIYRMMLQRGRRARWTSTSARAFVEDVMPAGTPDMQNHGVLDYRGVGWAQIAKAFNEHR